MRRRFPLFALALFALALAMPNTARAQTVGVGTFATGLSGARGLAMDASGRLYVSLRATNQIIRFSPPSNTPTVFVSAGLSDPIDMVFDDSGNLYVCNYQGARVSMVTPAGVVSTFCAAASPGALTRDAAGNLYVGEYFSQKILKVTPAGVVSLYATVGIPNSTRITALAMDPDGTLYTGDLYGPGVIYKIAPGGSPITTFSSGVGSILGLARGPGGDWLATNYGNNTISRISASGAHTLYAGGVTAGTTNGPLLTARFNLPSGILYAHPVVYIADYGNNRIRTIDFATPNLKSSWGRVKALYQ